MESRWAAHRRRRNETGLRETTKKLDAIVAAIEQGIFTDTTRDRLLELEKQKKTFEAALAEQDPTPYPSLHPNLVQIYKSKVAALQQALSDPEIRVEAGEILRSMIDRIEIATAPNQPANSGNRHGGSVEQRCQQPSDLSVTIYGQLAAIVGLAEEEEAIENKQRFSLVAGARYPLCRNRRILPWRRGGTLF